MEIFSLTSYAQDGTRQFLAAHPLQLRLPPDHNAAVGGHHDGVHVAADGDDGGGVGGVLDGQVAAAEHPDLRATPSVRLQFMNVATFILSSFFLPTFSRRVLGVVVALGGACRVGVS